MKIKLTIVILLLFSVFQTIANDQLTGRDLLRSCESVLINSASNIESMVCSWYTTPCECDQYDSDVPQVCLPAKIDERQLAKLLVNELANDLALQSAPAKFAANTVLVRYYPCNEI